MGTLTPQCPVANPTIVAVVLYELIGATAQPQSLEIVVACSVDQSASASLRGRQTVTKPHQFVTTRVWHIDRALRPAESWQNRGRGRGRNVTIPPRSAISLPQLRQFHPLLPRFYRNSAAILPRCCRWPGGRTVLPVCLPLFCHSAVFLPLVRFSSSRSRGARERRRAAEGRRKAARTADGGRAGGGAEPPRTSASGRRRKGMRRGVGERHRNGAKGGDFYGASVALPALLGALRERRTLRTWRRKAESSGSDEEETQEKAG